MQHQRSSSVLLCIETSGSLCGVALADAASHTLLADISFSEPFLHDRLLAEAVQSLMTMTAVTFGAIAAVAVSAGPGSFTGLRIGAAFAKALCFDNSPQLLPIPTPEAYALSALPSARILGKNRICVGIPSHKNLVYLQYFMVNGSANDSLEVNSEGPVQLVEEGSVDIQANTLYAGTAFAHSPKFPTLPELFRCTPAMIAEAAFRRFSEQALVLSEDFVPYYSQEFVPKTIVVH